MSRPLSLLTLLWKISFFATVWGVTGCRTLEEGTAIRSGFDQASFALADHDGDGKLTPREFAIHHHREALAEIDLDNDGFISAKEWAAAKPSSGANDELFLQMDENRDGKVSEEEAVSFILAHEDFIKTFEALDLNGDSLLHWEEIEQGAPDEIRLNLFSLHPEEGGDTEILDYRE